VIGQTISHYRIIEKLGEGGMGVVYKAEDLKLDRFVALKFLPRQLSADYETKARFIHEAKSASSLDHPNICAIHEIDETPDGQTFIVMPCYEGETLKERIKKGPLELDAAIEIMIQVGSGLAKAHEKGIVHRDNKPGNILVTTDGQVKLVDFGVAKLTGQTALTKTGVTVGTVGYMSPEQALGEAIDARSDVFSLGVVMYEMLAGRLPFRGEHEAAILYAIIHEEPQPLSKHRGDVPDVVMEVVERALVKDVAERYADAGELVRDLEAVRAELAAGRPLPRRWRRRAGMRMGRKRTVAVSAATILVIALVVAKLVWWPSVSEALAVVDFRDVVTPDDPTTSAGMTNLVYTAIVENTPGVRVISLELLHDLRRRLFDSARGPIDAGQALEVARQADASLLLSGQIGAIEGASYVTWQLVDVTTGKSLTARRVAGDNLAAIADQIVGGVLPLLAERSGVEAPGAPRSVTDMTSRSPKAYKHYTAGMLASEEMRLLDARREFQAAVDLDSTFALAFFELSRAYDLKVEKGAARAHADKAWNLRTSLSMKDRMRLDAWRERLEERDAEAISNYREMLARWPDDRDVLNDLLFLLYYLWYYDETVETAAQALELYPDDAMFGLFYGHSLAFIGRTGESVAAMQRYAEQHDQNPNAWDALALRYLAAGMPDSAEAAYRKALSIHAHFFLSQWGLGYCDYMRGDIERAIQTFELVLAKSDATAADSLALFTDVIFWPGLALLNAEAGRFQAALDVFEKAKQGVSLREGPRQLQGRIHLLLRMGRAADALRVADEVTTRAETRSARLSAKHYRIRALVALDSLDAARASAADLLAEEKGGAPRPFFRLRTATDIALAEGEPDKALQALDEMIRHGVPDGGLYDIERRESLARAQHMAGRSKQAVETLRELLRIYGSHVVARYQLGLVYEDMGRDADARAEYDAFLKAWARADDGLPQIADARARLSSLDARGK
jgi:tetratricopeptide (TPR) repeat protein